MNWETNVDGWIDIKKGENQISEEQLKLLMRDIRNMIDLADVRHKELYGKTYLDFHLGYKNACEDILAMIMAMNIKNEDK